MDLFIRDNNLNTIALIDNASSIIWNKKYNECGDFEIYIGASTKMIDIFRNDYYICRNDDSMLGIIERIELSTDVENGDYLTVSGRDLKSILGRRIVWTQTNLNGTVENSIRRLITENIINPSLSQRRIDNFVLGNPKGYSETMRQQFTGDNLLQAVSDICKTYNYGFDITLNSYNQFEFNVWKGIDRSMAQNINPHVVFSSDFDNLITSTYYYDKSEYKNTALILGEGEGVERKRRIIDVGSDLNRYELYVDARDLSSNKGSDNEIPEAEYLQELEGRGYEKLAERAITESFEPQIELTNSYVYKTDFDIGDIVTIRNDYGIEKNTRIVEMIESEDENGRTLLPALEN